MTRGDADYRDTDAARMLARGIRRVAQEDGLSQRELAKRLGYKQSTILSHMALGRVPIPVDRAIDLADHLHLDHKSFVFAVLHQRFPDVPWKDWLQGTENDDRPSDAVQAIELIAQCPIDELSPGQMSVMREVAADPHAERRWLTVHEVEAIELLRRSIPDLSTRGLPRQYVAEMTRLAERKGVRVA